MKRSIPHRLTIALVCTAALCFSLPARPQQDGIEAARTLHEQVLELLQQGNYVNAKPLAERAVELREKALGGEHLETAASLRNLAVVYEATGAQDQAESLYERVLAVREKLLGPEHPDTIDVLQDLGVLYFRKADYPQAEALYQRVLGVREKSPGPEHPQTGTTLTRLARLYDEMGLYAKSEPLHLRALAISEKALGAEHPNTARSLQNLGNVCIVKGDFIRAEALYRRALAIKEKTLGPEHPSTAEALYVLSIAYHDTGAYSKAIPLLERAVAIQEKASGLENRNAMLMVGYLAAVYHSAGDYPKARLLHERALALAEKVAGAEHPVTGNALFNFGMHYSFLGEHQKAEPLLLRSLAITSKLYGEDNREVADPLDVLATLYRQRGDYVRAEAQQQRALAVRQLRLGAQHPRTANSLQRLAVLRWVQGKSASALQLLQRAQAIQIRNSERFLLTGSEARSQAYLESLAADVSLDASFSLAVPGSDSAALGLASVLRHKARALDAVSDSVARLRQSVRPSDRALFDDLTQTAQELSTLTYQGSGELAPDAYRKRVEELTRQQEALEAVLAKNSGELRSELMPATLSAVRNAIPADAVLVEWLRFEPIDPNAKYERVQWRAPRYVAYTLRRTGKPVAVDLGAAADIEALVEQFRVAASDPERKDVRQFAAALSRRIIEPLRPHLGGARHLLLSPDSLLNLVPMAALLDERGRYLLERFEITYLTSGRDLVRIAASDALPSSNAVVMANPDYGLRLDAPRAEPLAAAPRERSEELDRAGWTFRSLPGTAQEADAIGRLLRNEAPRVLIADQATEANLKRVHGPRILHLATHGFFLRDQDIARVLSTAAIQSSAEVAENPLLRSGLALAGANQRRSGFSDDGILTALEASRLDLRGTELVVLSACETGVGETRSGAGITGLRRGLLLAGARSQVSTLWKVADLATKDLMVSFYGHLVGGAGRSAALRRAQRELLARPEQSHPYYWAGFVAVGDWTALPTAAAR